MPGSLMSVDQGKFSQDLRTLATRAAVGDPASVRSKLDGTVAELTKLYGKRKVKINHSALELVCALRFIRQGYAVRVEHGLDSVLVCDVYGERPGETFIVEIETGFIPPEAALQPSLYARSRVASKVARYSGHADRFMLGTTPSYVLDFPRLFVEPVEDRARAEAERVKELTDVYYNNPLVSVDEIMDAKLDSVAIIDVDAATAMEVSPRDYLAAGSSFLNGSRRTT
jgi:hypothetical protein